MNDPMSDVQRFAASHGWSVYYAAQIAPFRSLRGYPSFPRVGGIIDGRGGGNPARMASVAYDSSDFDPLAVAYAALHECGHTAQWVTGMMNSYADYAADKHRFELDAWDKALGWGRELGIVPNDTVWALIEAALASYKVDPLDIRAILVSHTS